MIYARATLQKQQIWLRVAMSRPAVSHYDWRDMGGGPQHMLDRDELPLGISSELWMLAGFGIAQVIWITVLTATRQPLSIRRFGLSQGSAFFRGPNHAERIAGSSMKDRFSIPPNPSSAVFFFLFSLADLQLLLASLRDPQLKPPPRCTPPTRPYS